MAPLPVSKKRTQHHHRVVSSDSIKGPRDGDEIREGTMLVGAKALNQGIARALISLVERDRGSCMFRGLLGEKTGCREPAKPPDRLSRRRSRYHQRRTPQHFRQYIRELGQGRWL